MHNVEALLWVILFVLVCGAGAVATVIAWIGGIILALWLVCLLPRICGSVASAAQYVGNTPLWGERPTVEKKN